jgi:ubiquinone/menaquinone biosynthesis C-methylase UbiE
MISGENKVTEKQSNVWDKNWEKMLEVDPHDILGSRFAREAYGCLRNFIDEKKDKVILEAGCGTGRLCCLLAGELPDTRVTGIDVSQNSLKAANYVKDHFSIPNVNFCEGDVFNIPFPDDCFDVVYNEGVIEHFSTENIPNYLDAVKEMARVAKKGGKVIAAVPNWYNFPHTVYKWTLKALGREYRYGYEKSFKHAELISLFLNSGLSSPAISGFYAGHGFYRLSGKGIKKAFYFPGKLTDIFEGLLPEGLRSRFAARFGIEIMIRGIK